MEYQAKLDKLISATRGRTWHAALACVLGNDMGYATDERKADFLYLLDVAPYARVLDLGCGLGPITVALAREVSEVHACDRLAGNAAFTQFRAHQDGFENVVCCAAGDDCALPYMARIFDLVVMNGVIEWVATTAPNAVVSAKTSQLALLREVYRTLKPGGTLYVSTKNRFALRYLLGKKDEHTGLPFTTVLPGALVRMLLRSIRGYDHRVKVHSMRSLERLLRKAGFSKPTRWALVPDFRHPSSYIKIDERAALRAAHKIGATRTRRPRTECVITRLLPSALAASLSYCFALETQRPSVL